MHIRYLAQMTYHGTPHRSVTQSPEFETAKLAGDYAKKLLRRGDIVGYRLLYQWDGRGDWFLFDMGKR